MTEPMKSAPTLPRILTREEEVDTIIEENRVAAEKRAQMRRAERDTFVAR